MRDVGYKVDADLLREDLPWYEEEFRAYDPSSRMGPAYHEGHMEVAMILARLRYLFDGSMDEIKGILRSALPALATAVERGGTLDPDRMPEYIGAARMVEDPVMVPYLEALMGEDVPPARRRMFDRTSERGNPDGLLDLATQEGT
jgi:hypothetical protein